MLKSSGCRWLEYKDFLFFYFLTIHVSIDLVLAGSVGLFISTYLI